MPTPISPDYSPILFSLSKEKGTIRDKGFCKFNSSLMKDKKYIAEFQKLIHNFS